MIEKVIAVHYVTVSDAAERLIAEKSRDGLLEEINRQIQAYDISGNR